MTPRRFEASSDLRGVVDLLGFTRANGGMSHPGGTQWWLREIGREGFDSFVVEGDGKLDGFVLIDDDFVLAEHRSFGDDALGLLDWTADYMRSTGRTSMTTHAPEGTDLERELESRGFDRTGIEYELMADATNPDAHVALPDGFRFGSLLEMRDDDYIEMHRAAWSDKRPSPYRRELHDRVINSPQFRPDLVTIVFAPDGRGASYCICWLDEQSRTVEIEPLGTIPEFRRHGLARALVWEVWRRAAANGASEVLVWNDPDNNPRPYALYTSAGMRPRRTLVALTKKL